jgi:HK97 family phage prohead protease
MPDTPPFTRVFQRDLHIKSWSEDPVTGEFTFDGYASTPDLDREGEVVSSQAMQEAIADYMKNPIITYCHDWMNPIGRALEAAVEPDGRTRIKAMISKSTQQGRDVIGLIKDKILKCLSIGFNGKGDKPGEMIGEAWYWRAIEWLETAVVPIPANPNAVFLMAKGYGPQGLVTETVDPRPAPEHAKDLPPSAEDKPEGATPTQTKDAPTTSFAANLAEAIEDEEEYEAWDDVYEEFGPLFTALRETLVAILLTPPGNRDVLLDTTLAAFSASMRQTLADLLNEPDNLRMFLAPLKKASRKPREDSEKGLTPEERETEAVIQALKYLRANVETIGNLAEHNAKEGRSPSAPTVEAVLLAMKTINAQGARLLSKPGAIPCAAEAAKEAMEACDSASAALKGLTETTETPEAEVPPVVYELTQPKTAKVVYELTPKPKE